eukprot:1143817-Pelagomonas_calceolata.AAC.6
MICRLSVALAHLHVHPSPHSSWQGKNCPAGDPLPSPIHTYSPEDLPQRRSGSFGASPYSTLRLQHRHSQQQSEALSKGQDEGGDEDFTGVQREGAEGCAEKVQKGVQREGRLKAGTGEMQMCGEKCAERCAERGAR